MAHNAKTAREERGMNPLFLCLGMLRWPYKPGVFADAPLILVPVNIAVARGRQDFTLSLDTSQQTTPNAALIEWLRREHGLSIPDLAEPLTDRAGIDVDGVLAEVRARSPNEAALSTSPPRHGWPSWTSRRSGCGRTSTSTPTTSSSGRWSATSSRRRPRPFEDPAVEAAGDAASDEAFEEKLEKLETPIPADSTQKRAVLWARQGRTFVLQGPPGTGKSQTITNMVAECLLAGLRVLFVAEKGTALAVVQRRLDAIGLGPFTLNLHHEGSNAAEVRAQLKRSLTATVNPDTSRWRVPGGSCATPGSSSRSTPSSSTSRTRPDSRRTRAHDELLVFGDGRRCRCRRRSSPTRPSRSRRSRSCSRTSAVDRGRRRPPGHPWRFAGVGQG